MLEPELVRLAHSDAWQELGRLFEGRGGGTAECRGARLMASGLPEPQWNSGDVLDSDVDLDAVRAFYSAHRVRWGLRVPRELAWSHGRFVMHQRLMGLVPAAFRHVAAPPGFHYALATIADLESVVHVDAVAFGSDRETTRPWFAALLAAPTRVVTFVRALADGQTVGTGYCVLANGQAGLGAYVGGIAVLPAYRRRGCASALSSWLVDRGLTAGARLVHLHPDDDRAASLYAKLGFVEAGGLDIYVDVCSD
jgi:GNAT superfamily N-acetyltransferase